MFPPSNIQVPDYSNALVQTPATHSAASNESPTSMRSHLPNGGPGTTYDNSVDMNTKKLQDELASIGANIKQHEENLKVLRKQKKLLDDSVLDMQVSLGKYHSRGTPKVNAEGSSHGRSEEEIIGQILKHDKSAAGILCLLNNDHPTEAAHNIITQDVLGLVATLGKVDDEKVSRLLSEYLGLETMLGIVCKSYKGVTDLERYDNEGIINELSGLHGLGASIGSSLEGRFNVICLEHLRPYAGDFMPDDPQRRLNIVKPRVPNGDLPSGFLGFAVNMITVDPSNLFCLTPSGCGIRETLFYHLFSSLQVYRTRTEMLLALPCITDGAISLDGGMIRKLGIFSLGTRKNVDIIFPRSCRRLELPEEYLQIENQLKQRKRELDLLQKDMQREESLLGDAKAIFQAKKLEFVKFLATASSILSQMNERAQNQPYQRQF